MCTSIWVELINEEILSLLYASHTINSVVPPLPPRLTLLMSFPRFLLVGLFATALVSSRTSADDNPIPPTVLFLVGEVEYGTAESLPVFAQEVLRPLGYRSEFIFAASTDRSSPDIHRFDGLEDALKRADLLFISTRRRFLNSPQMAGIRSWVADGKPVIGIRTASHAFGAKPRPGYTPTGDQQSWDTIDRDLFGMRYDGHYGNDEGQTMVRRVREFAHHPIMAGFNGSADQPVTSSLYRNPDIDERAAILLSGHLENRPETYQPVSWAIEKGGSRTFYTSLGDPDHFKLPWFQNHVANAIGWALQKPLPSTDQESEFLEKDYEASSSGKSPDDSLASMRTPADLEVDLLAAEPGIKQPVFLNFDERGRMWVVEYRQYPEPAGLELVSRDQFWRNVYDRKPQPPGHPEFTPGLDRISILEDTDGDGSFDKSKVFVDGLSLATSVVKGKDGAWVLNPPYLLFYPDADDNDRPDGDPVVHLDGFGIQDSHSVVSSLCWGPDGWLYGAQGSTVTSDIVVIGSDAPPISRVGQLMWRYHPEHRQYEVFAEGGGNIWSCEFDAQGRLMAGTNDRYPGYYYLQGAFYKKNFGKHGALSNPHAYDYFEGINAPGHRRISNSILKYEGAALPERYDESLLYLGTLQGKMGSYQLVFEGLNYRGEAIDLLLDADDRWFRPVYMETGPDGAVYLCDWYDQQVNHYRNHEGIISKIDGRIFRVRAKNSAPIGPIDFRQISTAELVDVLNYRNRWWRETAQQQLRWRDDRMSVVPRLNDILRHESGQFALESLWALNLLNAFDDAAFDSAINHTNPAVRMWAIRLVGDQRSATLRQTNAIVAAIKRETNHEVLSQAASSAGRLPVADAMQLIAVLVDHELAQIMPDLERVIWWTLEPFYAENPDAVLGILLNLAKSRPTAPLPDLTNFLMRRMASAGTPADLRRCAELLTTANHDSWATPMVAGFVEAFKGRSMAGLPVALEDALVATSHPPMSLLLRLDTETHLEAALNTLNSDDSDRLAKLHIVEVLGETRIDAARDPLINRLQSAEGDLLPALIAALQIYDDPRIGQAVIAKWESLDGRAHEAAEALLTSRLAWSRQWTRSWNAASAKQVAANSINQLRRFDDDEIDAVLDHWLGQQMSISNAGFETEVARVKSVLSAPGGDPIRGHEQYQQRCAACHMLFDEGGAVGPDLTSYQREDTDTLLLSIIHPNAEIRAGYEMTSIETKDGRLLSGFITRNDEGLVGIRMMGGNEVILQRDQISNLEMQERSLMPESLLSGMSDEDLRDLFNYLRIPQPLNIKN